jgi:uncharacterized protein YbaP (TraB family)
LWWKRASATPREKITILSRDEGHYRGDDLLWNHITRESRQNLERLCSKYEFPVEGFAKMKPWLASILAFALSVKKSGIDTGEGIDRYFLDRSNQAKDRKRLVEMESLDRQYKLLSGLADDIQESLLAEAMEAVSRMPERNKRMEDAWLSGDADHLDKLMNEPTHSTEQVRKALGRDRNPHMADVAEQFLNGKEQAFVVVGAGSLVGKDGVVSILRTRGYKVEQVSLRQ